MGLVSVVIPTLGKINLLNTISILNSGSIVPSEIIICLPIETRLAFDIPGNVKILYSTKRSQVAQRALGLKEAKSEYVLQLDDDTHLATDCLEKLVSAIMDSQVKCAVSPSILNMETNESIYKNEYSNTLFSKIRYFIANGRKLYKPGTITGAGTCFGPKYTPGDESIVNVEWLAGCCILHKKENLIFDDYYPFEGKAYCEDLIASYLYKKNSISFFCVSGAKCFTVPNEQNSGTFPELIKEQKIRKYYLIMSGNSTTRYYIYAVFRYIYEVIVNYPKKILNKLK